LDQAWSQDTKQWHKLTKFEMLAATFYQLVVMPQRPHDLWNQQAFPTWSVKFLQVISEKA
jgi:hypothetical protein